MSSSCPSQNDLQQFLQGLLAPDRGQEIAAHIETCLNCDAVLAELESAPAEGLMKLVSQGAPATSEMNELHGADQDLAFSLAVRHACQLRQAAQEKGDAADTLPIDTEIGPYRLHQLIGRGGMGQVYLAEHTRLERPIALKILPTDRVRDRLALDRFYQEMRAVGRLDHPNIVRATDAGDSDGIHFLAMDYVPGLDTGLIARHLGQLSVADACEIVRQAAEGLQHAHDNQLVHRDIKPSNLMLSPDGRVRILDLGLARLNSGIGNSPSGLTSSGMIMGTLDFMAPEQGDNSRDVDIRADIYSLGATLYRLLTGTAPFGDASFDSPMKKLVALATQEPVPVRNRRADIPEELVEIVQSLLTKEPDGRPSNPGDVAAALTRFAQEHHLPTLCQKAADAAGVDLTSNSADRTVLAPAATDTVHPVSSGLSDTFAKADHAVTQEVAASTLTLTPPRRSHFKGLAIGFVTVALAVALYFNTGEGTLEIKVHADDISVTVDGDNRQYDISSDRDHIIVKVPAGSHQVEVTRDGFTVWTQQFHIFRNGRLELEAKFEPKTPIPNGKGKTGVRQLPVSGEYSDLYARWQAAIGTPESIPIARALAKSVSPFDHLNRHDISLDEMTTAGAGDPENVAKAIIAIFGDSRFQMPGGIPKSDVNPSSISPDGKWIAWSPEGGSPRVFDAATGRPVFISEEGSHAIFAPVSGDLVLSLPASNQIQFLQAPDWDIERKIDAERSEIGSAAITPDGKTLLTTGHDSDTNGRAFSVVDIQTLASSSSWGVSGEVSQIAISPDGKYAAAILREDSQLRLKIWETQTGILVDTVDEWVYDRLTFSPDSKTIYLKELRQWSILEKRFLSHEPVPDFDNPFICRTEKPELFALYEGLPFDPDGSSKSALWNSSLNISMPLPYPLPAFLHDDGRLVEAAVQPLAEMIRSRVKVACSLPDGKSILFSNDETQWRLEFSAGPPETHLSDETLNPLTGWNWHPGEDEDLANLDTGNSFNGSLAYSHDGKLVARTPQGRQAAPVRLQSTADDGPSQELLPKERWDSVRFSADDSLLAGGSSDGKILVWQLENHKSVFETNIEDGQFPALAFSHDTELLACVSRTTGQIQVFQLNDDERPAIHEFLHEGAEQLAFSPDRRYLATAGTGGWLKIWNLEPESASHSIALGTTNSVVNQLSFLPDSRHVLCTMANGTALLIRVQATRENDTDTLQPESTVSQQDPGSYSIDKWIKGRSRLTVSKDGSADFDNINAAVSKLKEGQYVEILDAGPYRERLAVKPPANTGLISRADTVILLSEWTHLNDPFGPFGHVINPYESFRLHGISFTYERKRQGVVLDIPRANGLIMSNCVFTGKGGTDFEIHQPRVGIRSISEGDSNHPNVLLIENIFNDPLHLWALGSRPGRINLRNNLFLGHNMHYAIIPRSSDLENRYAADALPKWEFEIDRNVFFDLLGGRARGILVDDECAPAFSIRLTHNTLVGRRYSLLLKVADEKVLNSVHILGNVIATDGRAVDWPTASQRKTWLVEDNILESTYPESSQVNHLGRPSFQSIDLQSPHFLKPGPDFPKTADGMFVGALQPSNPGDGPDWLSKLIQRWIALETSERNNVQ